MYYHTNHLKDRSLIPLIESKLVTLNVVHFLYHHLFVFVDKPQSFGYIYTTLRIFLHDTKRKKIQAKKERTLLSKSALIGETKPSSPNIPAYQ